MPCSSPPLSPALIAVVSLVVTRPSWVVNETLTRWMMHIHCCRHRPAGSVSTLTAKVHPPRILDPPTTDHRGRWLNWRGKFRDACRMADYDLDLSSFLFIAVAAPSSFPDSLLARHARNPWSRSRFSQRGPGCLAVSYCDARRVASS